MGIVIMLPKLFPAVTIPIIRPRMRGNQMFTNRPAGIIVAPGVPANIKALNR